MSESNGGGRFTCPIVEFGVDRDAPREELIKIIEKVEQDTAILRDIVESQVDVITQMRLRQEEQLVESSRKLRSAITILRQLWGNLADADRATQTSLAALHGLAERLVTREVTARVLNFFDRHLDRIREKRSDSVALENEATFLGLPVLDPEESVVAINANFGIVEEVRNDQARVILLDDTDGHILDDFTVPINWLPLAYRDDGVGIAWVERRYASGVKGRFEPASTREDRG